MFWQYVHHWCHRADVAGFDNRAAGAPQGLCRCRGGASAAARYPHQRPCRVLMQGAHESAHAEVGHHQKVATLASARAGYPCLVPTQSAHAEGVHHQKLAALASAPKCLRPALCRMYCHEDGRSQMLTVARQRGASRGLGTVAKSPPLRTVWRRGTSRLTPAGRPDAVRATRLVETENCKIFLYHMHTRSARRRQKRAAAGGLHFTAFLSTHTHGWQGRPQSTWWEKAGIAWRPERTAWLAGTLTLTLTLPLTLGCDAAGWGRAACAVWRSRSDCVLSPLLLATLQARVCVVPACCQALSRSVSRAKRFRLCILNTSQAFMPAGGKLV
eukprot:365739-Chlamydomonas_euryale.AAC.4